MIEQSRLQLPDGILFFLLLYLLSSFFSCIYLSGQPFFKFFFSNLLWKSQKVKLIYQYM